MIHPKACKQPPWQPQLDLLDARRRWSRRAWITNTRRMAARAKRLRDLIIS